MASYTAAVAETRRDSSPMMGTMSRCEIEGNAMSQPFVYVGTWTIKPGKLEEAKRFLAEHAAFVERSEPRLIAFHVYFE
jgi:hypothetical protein